MHPDADFVRDSAELYFHTTQRSIYPAAHDFSC